MLAEQFLSRLRLPFVCMKYSPAPQLKEQIPLKPTPIKSIGAVLLHARFCTLPSIDGRESARGQLPRG